MGIKLDRLELVEKLKTYLEGVISLNELQEWELDMERKNYEPTDRKEDESLINEIMHIIDMSDIDGLSKKDVPWFIELLSSNKDSMELVRALPSRARTIEKGNLIKK